MNYQLRLKNLQSMLSTLNCEGFLVEDSTNLYYMTGISIGTGVLLVTKNGAFILVDQRYFELCQKNAPFPVLPSETTSIASLTENLKGLGFDSENSSFKRFKDLEKSVKCPLIPVDNPIKTLRMLKDGDELNLLKQAAALGSAGFDYVCALLREGITEKEVALELEIFWKREGGKGVAFDPIIAFGANGSMPHYRAGATRLEKGMAVLVDIGVNLASYHSDMTRMVFFGEPPAEIQTIHAIVERAQHAALASCIVGMRVGDLDAVARDIITQAGFGAQFTHSLGHGVGLEIHEAPTLRNKPPMANLLLQPGMVITIEPGIYLPGVGGVRIEDTLIVTQNGSENLTLRTTAPFFIKI